MIKRKSRSFVVFLLMMLVFSSCGQEKRAEVTDVRQVEESLLEVQQTAVVERKDMERCVWMPGYVAPKVYQLKFEEQGYFGEYKVNIGDEVKKGQLLAALSSVNSDREQEKLEKQLKDLTTEYEFQVSYIDKTVQAYKKQMDGYYAKLKDERNPLNSEEYSMVCLELGILETTIKNEELRKTQLKEAFELDSAYVRSQLNGKKNAGITAPCDGVVIAMQSITEGSYTEENYYYLAIAQKDVYYVGCEYIAPAYLDGIIKTAGFRNGKDYELNYIPMDETLYMELKNNGEDIVTNFEITSPDEDIDYGNEIVVKLVVNEKKNVLTLPAIAIEGDASGWYVYRKTPEGREKVYVTIGLENQLTKEIQSGLEEGDIIYVPK